MTKTSATALLEQARPQEEVFSQTPTTILPESRPEVKGGRNALAQLRIERGIPVMDMVELVRTIYPKYDRIMHSKVEHGEEYGIRLRADAQRALLTHFAPDERKARQKPRRTKPHRVQVRLTEAAYSRLQMALTRSGKTMQTYIEELILGALANKPASGQS